MSGSRRRDLGKCHEKLSFDGHGVTITVSIAKQRVSRGELCRANVDSIGSFFPPLAANIVII